MSQYSKTDLQTLDIIDNGSPFLNVSAGGTSDSTLDIIDNGSPFLSYGTASSSGTTVEATGAWTSNFDVSAIGGLIIEGSSNLSSQFTQTATISHINGADLFAMTNASLSAEAAVIRDNNIALSSVFSIATDASRTRNYSSEDAADFTISVANQRVRFNEAAIDAAFSLTANVEKIQGGVVREADAALEATTTLEAQGQRNQFAESAIEFTASQSVTALRIQDTSAEIQSAFTTSTTGQRIRFGAGAFSSAFSEVVDGNKVSPLYTWYADPGFGSYTFDTTKRAQPTTSGASIKYSANSDYQTIGLFVQGSNFETSYSRSLLDAGTQNHCFEFWFAGTDKSNPTATFAPPQWYTNSGDWVILDTYSYRLRYSSTNGFTLAVIGKDNVTYNANTVQNSSLRVNYTLTHIAIVRSGTTVQLFINGTRCRSATLPSNYDIAATPSIYFNGLGNYYYNIDEFRYSIGTNRYATGSNFTPSTTKYTTDNYTRLLSHFDSNEGVNGRVFAQAALVSETFALAEVSKFSTVNATADLTSTAQVTAALSRTQQVAADLTAFATEVIVNGRIVPEQASLECSFFMTASLDKIKNVQADLNSTVTTDATGQRIRYGQATLASQATLTASGQISARNFSANLVSTSSCVLTYEREFARFIYSPSGSGYISSPGTTIAPPWNSGTLYGFQGVTINFWFKLEQPLIDNPSMSGPDDVVQIYTDMSGDSANLRIQIRRENYRSYLDISIIYKYSRYNGTNYTPYQKGYIRSYDITDVELTNWTNFHGSMLPSIVQNYNGTTAGDPTVTWQDAYINGQLNLAGNSQTVTGTQTGTNGAWSAPTFYTADAVDGGEWASGTTRKQDLFLDSIWIKKNTTVTVDQFYNNGYDQFVTNDGTTLNGTTADVWLTFSDLLDHASNSPTWNYTAYNQVRYGFVFEGQAYLNSNFSQNIINAYLRLSTAQLHATASLNSTALRLRKSAVALSSTASLTGNLIIARSGRVTAESTATLAVTSTQVNKAFASQQQATASLTANNTRLRYGQAALTAQATITINATKIARTSSSQQATATQQATALRIQKSAVSLLAFATELAAVVKIGQGLLAMDSSFSTTVIGTKNTDTASNQTANFDLVANNVFVKNADAALTSQATVTANVDKIKKIEVTAQATTSLTAQVDVTKGFQAQLQDNNSQLTAEITRSRSTVADLQVNTSLNVEVTKYRSFSAALQAAFEQVSNPYNVARAEAHLEAFDTVLAVGSRIRFDPYYMLKIEPESRVLTVHEESRVLMVTSETRILKVKETTYD